MGVRALIALHGFSVVDCDDKQCEIVGRDLLDELEDAAKWIDKYDVQYVSFRVIQRLFKVMSREVYEEAERTNVSCLIGVDHFRAMIALQWALPKAGVQYNPAVTEYFGNINSESFIYFQPNASGEGIVLTKPISSSR